MSFGTEVVVRRSDRSAEVSRRHSRRSALRRRPERWQDARTWRPRTGHAAEYPGHWLLERWERVKPRRVVRKGPKLLRWTPLSDSPARRETPAVLNPSNRRIRTRTYGGVGGEESRDSPYPDLSRAIGIRCGFPHEIPKFVRFEASKFSECMVDAQGIEPWTSPV